MALTKTNCQQFRKICQIIFIRQLLRNIRDMPYMILKRLLMLSIVSLFAILSVPFYHP